ncbi:LAFE_0E03092g1_1 [Lachancea fermentati]|uniref:LAFE_0E03092g1_1 n=1 Tax=Lachancea fermentati TaxID=4955 RepID=A0A1G4MCP6_LACFM|nr:LAFE_0E03092g1_1 [Lachancea fermentati]
MTVTYKDVAKASDRIKNYVNHTPVLTSRTLNEKLEAQCFFKCENFQRVGAFKFRGDMNTLLSLSDREREAGVVAFSSGNHAQAVSLASKILGVKATIVMPYDAPAAKMAATREYGGNVVLYDRYKEDREAIGRELVASKGYTLIPPFNHAMVIAGQGTATKELIEEVGNLDYLFVPLGGGGLLSGSSLSAKTLSPSCTVIGVEPEKGNDGQQSFRSGKLVRIDTPDTIADGAQTQQLGELTFSVIKEHVDDIITVSDEELITAMKFFAERMKIVVEPTGCLGLAGALSLQHQITGRRIGVIVSGGNVDLARYGKFISS